jgi:hypothetical protein
VYWFGVNGTGRGERYFDQRTADEHLLHAVTLDNAPVAPEPLHTALRVRERQAPYGILRERLHCCIEHPSRFRNSHSFLIRLPAPKPATSDRFIGTRTELWRTSTAWSTLSASFAAAALTTLGFFAMPPRLILSCIGSA